MKDDSHPEGSPERITEDEAALYDRQIRLWGLDAQKRLHAAKVLLIGVGGLGAEVAKNIILSGIKSMTLLDHNKVTKEDFCCQFLIKRDDLGKNRAEASVARAQQLNPLVELIADTDNVADKPDDFFKKFSIVIATGLTRSQYISINQVCSENQIKYYAADVFGHYGYMVADLGAHEYAEDVPRSSIRQAHPSDGESPAKKHKPDPDDTVTLKKMDRFNTVEGFLSGLNPGNFKKIPNTYMYTSVLLDFRGRKGRNPDTASLEEDKEMLVQMRPDYLKELNTFLEKSVANTKPSETEQIFSPVFANYCFAELSPVCAVVGGMLAQEIIKAVSHKDAPHRCFFYNGVDGSGMAETAADASTQPTTHIEGMIKTRLEHISKLENCAANDAPRQVEVTVE